MTISNNAHKIMIRFKQQFGNDLREGRFIKSILLRDEVDPKSDWSRAYSELIESGLIKESETPGCVAITKIGTEYLNNC